MITGIELPLQHVRPVRIRDLEETALCLSYDNRGIHLLIDHLGDHAQAVFLNGEYAFRSFKVDAVHDWKGLAITNFGVIVDVGSGLNTYNEWPPLGALTIGPRGVELQVENRDHHGFFNNEGLRLSFQGPEVNEGLGVSFTKWAFQIGDNKNPEFVWVNAGRENSRELAPTP